MQVFEFQHTHIIDSFMSGWVYSSNGLLCVKLRGNSQDCLWLWNPAIRVVRQVPKSLNNHEHGCFSVGFGFSPIINDYKIVKFFLPGYFVVQAEVYSLRTGLWREVEVGNLEGVYGLGCGAFPCNGAIFWIGQKKDVEGHNKRRVELIVSFDIAREVFTLIPFPTMTSAHGCYNTLAIFKNKLALFFPSDIENSESYVIDLWVLEECTDPTSERWSWAKIYTSRPNPYRFIICPEIIWRNEIVCLVEALPEYQNEGEEENYEGKVVFCNVTTDEFNLFDIPQCSYSFEILDYVESLEGQQLNSGICLIADWGLLRKISLLKGKGQKWKLGEDFEDEQEFLALPTMWRKMTEKARIRAQKESKCCATLGADTTSLLYVS
ncbi:hypothetical protein K1719_033360 [Acacia pycnantha]|nr:hypothetical protein K1719_033360 [Acacia pycnantha]